MSRNLILIGKAYEIDDPRIRHDVKILLDNPGFYLGTGVETPGAECPMVSVDGKIYELVLGQELDPASFQEGVLFYGPYRIPHKP